MDRRAQPNANDTPAADSSPMSPAVQARESPLLHAPLAAIEADGGPHGLRLAREALQRAQQAGDIPSECDALSVLAVSYAELGHHDLALQSARHAVQLARQHGHAACEGRALGRLGSCHALGGDPAEAERWLLRSLARARELRSVDDSLLALESLTAVTLHAGRTGEGMASGGGDQQALLRSRDYATQTLALAQRMGGSQSISAQALLGEVLSQLGDHAAAEAVLRESVEQARGQGLHEIEAQVRCVLAELLAATGRQEQGLKELHGLLDELGPSSGKPALRRQAHRAAWKCAKALQQFELALTHCEAVLALTPPGGQLPAETQGHGGPRQDQPVRLEVAGLDAPTDADHASEAQFIAREIAPLVDQVRLRRKPLALAALEVDQLGALSVRAGQAAVDAALRQLGDLMRQRLRARDLPLRRGSTAFVLALSDTPPAAASAICERLRAAVEQHDWSRLAPGAHLTLSIGLVASVNGSDAAAELRRADEALRAARGAGGNRVSHAPAA